MVINLSGYSVCQVGWVGPSLPLLSLYMCGREILFHSSHLYKSEL